MNQSSAATPVVLFVCVHDAGRSQMAAALVSALSGGKAVALSAGTMPAEHVHPEVVERNARNRPGPWRCDPAAGDRRDAGGGGSVITMGCNVDDACPGAVLQSEEWGLPDPKGRPMDEIRAIRDTIHTRVPELLEELGIPAQDAAGVVQGNER